MDHAGLVRSEAQRMEALNRANVIRSWRATAKERMRNGELTATEVLRQPPPQAYTMKVGDLLLAVPSVGRVKMARLLRDAGISPSKTVIGITPRQRKALLRVLDGR